MLAHLVELVLAHLAESVLAHLVELVPAHLEELVLVCWTGANNTLIMSVFLFRVSHNTKKSSNGGERDISEEKCRGGYGEFYYIELFVLSCFLSLDERR